MVAATTKRYAREMARTSPSIIPACIMASERGSRSSNQDYCGYADWSTRGYNWQVGGAIYLVADGMGGHAGGERASQIAVRETIGEFSRLRDHGSLRSRLSTALMHANDRVLRDAGSAATPDMGSTVVACAIQHGRAVIGHVGDSRAYLLREGNLLRLTQDHTYPRDVLCLSDEDAKDHHMNHVLSRVVGRQDTEPEVGELPCYPGDRFLLCTDGLTNALSDGEIRQALSLSSGSDAVRALADRTRPRASDNFTAMVVTVGEAEEAVRTTAKPWVVVGTFGSVLMLTALVFAMMAMVGDGGGLLHRPAKRQVAVTNKTDRPITVLGADESKVQIRDGDEGLLTLDSDLWVIEYQVGERTYWKGLESSDVTSVVIKSGDMHDANKVTRIEF